ncbi:putative receptor-like protein kinase At2g42960 isoform X2 [Bidens hawaiensis]|uniref:putative receptor-like protein kinase At2g42960 isoform X2 n=1 Tax=Bidens hawaiensis TaxID=980011 RepID=UPI0040498D55
MSTLDTELSKKTSIMGLKLWVVICVCVVVLICMCICLLSMWVMCQKKSRRRNKYPLSQIPNVPKDIRVDSVGGPGPHNNFEHSSATGNNESGGNKGSGKMLFQLGVSKYGDADNVSQSSSMYERGYGSRSGEEGTSGSLWKQSSRGAMGSPFVGLPETSHLGWGHWFTLRDLEQATGRFSSENVVGEGGYGVVYKGTLVNGTEVAVKKLLNNLGQAEKEFRVEVEAIGHVRHKNLVRLLGYCIEGTQRMLVYEYVDNGNLEQWLHGDTQESGVLTWEARMKVLLGIAKALAYLHEAIEPKVVHRDIKSSNILIDHDFNGKLSDFGLAKLLDAGESHINTRVMGTFGYVAPEYANTGMLNEKSDIYSFGVLLLEAVTGRDPVDYSRVANEVQ